MRSLKLSRPAFAKIYPEAEQLPGAQTDYQYTRRFRATERAEATVMRAALLVPGDERLDMRFACISRPKQQDFWTVVRQYRFFFAPFRR